MDVEEETPDASSSEVPVHEKEIASSPMKDLPPSDKVGPNLSPRCSSISPALKRDRIVSSEEATVSLYYWRQLGYASSQRVCVVRQKILHFYRAMSKPFNALKVNDVKTDTSRLAKNTQFSSSWCRGVILNITKFLTLMVRTDKCDMSVLNRFNLT